MAIFIILVVIIVCLWLVFCYLAINFIASKLIRPTADVNKKIVFTISFVVAGLSMYFLFFSTPSRNYKTAYIEPYQAGYKVTVKGKRVAMAHDPVSAFLRKTYEDSMFFLIPRHNGVLQNNEIIVSQDKQKPIGTITFEKEKMIINLFYDHTKSEPDSWNGKYILRFK